MKITTAEFTISSTGFKSCPKPIYPEYAFTGRSNVGKSSLINALTGRKKLAKISETPGKTQLINHFLINNSWYLVDLPGYGYAKTSKKEKSGWDKMIREYILNRPNLLSLFLLVDSRHNPQKADLEFAGWLGGSRIPFALVFTKIDKLSRYELNKNTGIYQNILLKSWSVLPPVFLTSSARGEGKEEILNYIEDTNGIFNPKGFKIE